MNRDHMNDEEKEAMRLLDLVRLGMPVPPQLVMWALVVTGDAVGLK